MSINTINYGASILGQSVVNLKNQLTNLQSQVDGLAAGGTAGGAATPNAVAYDTAAHDRLTLGSTSGGTTKLSGLTDGSLAAGSTDAVTGNQLFATNNQVASLTSAVQNISTTGSSSIGINGTIPQVGQAYIPLNTTITGSAYSPQGEVLSNIGTVIGLQSGPATDQFFLTFDRLGDHTNVVVEATPTAPAPAIAMRIVLIPPAAEPPQPR